MKPIQVKKIRHCRSTHMIPKQLEARSSWNTLDLSKPEVHSGSDDVMVTDRFHSVPFQLFVSGNIKPMTEEVESDTDAMGNMTERFTVRSPLKRNPSSLLRNLPNPNVLKPSPLAGHHGGTRIFTIEEDDEENDDFTM